MSTKEDLKAQAVDSKIDYANIVNELTGKKPTEYQIQAAEHFANQVTIAKRMENPHMTEEEAKQMVASYKKAALESGDLKELADEMTADLKDPSRLEAKQNNAKAFALRMQKVFGDRG